MSRRARLPNGVILQFPDNTPDDVMDKAVAEQIKVLTTPSRGTVTVDEAKKAFDASRTPDTRSAGQVAKDQTLSNLYGIGQFAMETVPQTIASIPAMLGGTGTRQGALNNIKMFHEGGTAIKNTIAPLLNDAAIASAGYYGKRPSDFVPMSTPEQQQEYARFSGQNAGAVLLGELIKGTPSVARALSEAIPSKARAGVKFQNVMGKARNVPLNLSIADDAALRAQELAGRGALPGRGHSMPKVMRDYLRTRESTRGMTYEVGRDFQSSAGKLSVAESLATKGPMKAEVSKLAKALAESNREAAKKVGMGAEYDAAMSEYRRAARIGNILESLKKNAPKAAIGSGVGYGLYKALGNN